MRDDAYGADTSAVPPTDGTDNGSSSSFQTSHLLLGVVAAFNVAIAQPLLDVVGRNPAFFVAHDAGPADVVVLSVGLALIVPLALGACLAVLMRMSRAAGVASHYVVMTAILSALGVRVLRGLPLPDVGVVVLGLLLGALATLVLIRTGAVGRILAVVIVIPVATLTLFLVMSPASALVRPGASTVSGEIDLKGDSPPIVWIIFDELPLTSLLDPSYKIDERSFPSFATVADDATLFRNVTAVHPNTEVTVPALLTGRFHERGQLPVASDHRQSVFSLLSPAYEVAATEPVTQLCPAEVCRTTRRPPLSARLLQITRDLLVIAQHVFFPEGAASRLPAVDEGWRDFRVNESDVAGRVAGGAEEFRERFGQATSSDRGAQFRRAVRSIQPSNRPRLDVIHALLPHARWEYLPEGQSYTKYTRVPGLDDEKTWVDDEWLTRQAYQRHLYQVEFVDRLVGRLIRHLEAEDIYDKTLLVITADHGVSFEPLQHYRHFADETAGGTAWVPLLIKAPHQDEPAIDDRPLLSVDILPTVLDLLGVEPGRLLLDGRSALDAIPADRDRSIPGHADWPSFSKRHLQEALREKFDVFPELPARKSSNSLTPDARVADLLGTPVPAQRVETAHHVVLNEPNMLQSVDTAAQWLPVEIEGRLITTVRGDVTVAFGLNGRFEAVTLARPDDSGDLRFTALLPPEALVPGANRLEPFVVTDDGLAPAPVTAEKRARDGD